MILVTGGAGYIGSHVVLKLLESSQFSILVFDSLENGHFWAVDALQKVRSFGFVQGDLKKSDDVKELFEKHQIEAVMHFAAYISVEESVKNPRKYYQNNLCGTLNLINSMVDHDVKKLVFSSTAAVYGEPKYTPIDENHPTSPINPYGRTKIMVEEILKDYDSAYGLKSVKLRYFNVAGADSKGRIGELHVPETHLIPNILKSSNDVKDFFNLYGNDYNTKDGTCVRDYVNVEDLAEAHNQALQYLLTRQQSDCVNIGTRTGSTVKEVLETCEKIMSKEINIKVNPRRDGDPANLIADNSKALRVLGWQPTRTLEDTVSTAYRWLNK